MLLRYAHNLIDDPTRREAWDRWEDKLLRLPDTHHQSWTDGSGTGGDYEDSMGFAAVTRLGAISCMIKHHDKFPLRRILDNAVACFLAAIDAWNEVMGRR